MRTNGLLIRFQFLDQTTHYGPTGILICLISQLFLRHIGTMFKGEKQTSLAAVTIHLNRKARALRLKKNCLISWSFLVEIRRSL